MNTLRFLSLAALLAFAAGACTSPLLTCQTNQCYNPSTNSCPIDDQTGKPVLCPKGMSACNGGCYDPTVYHCANGLQPGAAVKKSTTSTVAASKSTTSSTVAPSTSSTTSSTVASTSSTTSNPVVTSSSTVQAAASGAAAAPVCAQGSCPSGLCSCNGACYPPSQYCCLNNQLTQIAFCGSQANVATLASSSSTSSTTSSQAVPATSSTTSSQAAPATSSSTSSQAVAATSSTTSSQAAAATSAASGLPTCVQGSCPSTLCSCNGACYQPSQYCCLNNQLTQIGQCPVGTPTVVPTRSSTAAAAVTSVSNPVVNPSPVVGQLPKQTADLRIINSCKSTLWFEARYGGQGAPIPGQTATATIALPGGYVDYTIPATGLSGSRFWAKYGCDVNGKNCLVGDQMQYWPNPPGGCPANGCTPPVDSLFEATWGCRPGASCNAQNPTTWFDTSQVDGWTIPYRLTPNGDTSGCDCVGSNCGFSGVDASRLDLARCPKTEDLTAGGLLPSINLNGQNVNLQSVDLRIINNGSVLGCLSPCKRLNWGTPYGLAQPESAGSTLWMCCPTPTPDNCSPANGCVSPTACRQGPIENTQYVAAVHDMAPGIYSYSYDDGVGLHACPAGVVTYTMEFCPAGSSAYPAQA